MTTLELGGGLKVTKHDDYFSFRNDGYGMMCRIYEEDIQSFIQYPRLKYWGRNSNSNNISSSDIDKMIEYLSDSHGTIDDIISSEDMTNKEKTEKLSRYSLSSLMDTLYILKKEKEEANGKIKSSC